LLPELKTSIPGTLKPIEALIGLTALKSKNCWAFCVPWERSGVRKESQALGSTCEWSSSCPANTTEQVLAGCGELIETGLVVTAADAQQEGSKASPVPPVADCGFGPAVLMVWNCRVVLA